MPNLAPWDATTQAGDKQPKTGDEANEPSLAGRINSTYWIQTNGLIPMQPGAMSLRSLIREVGVDLALQDDSGSGVTLEAVV